MTIRNLITDLLKYDLDGEVDFEYIDSDETLQFHSTYPKETNIYDWSGNSIVKTVNGCTIRIYPADL